MKFFIGQNLSLPNDMSLTIHGLETNYKPWKITTWKVVEVFPNGEEDRIEIESRGKIRICYVSNIIEKLNFLKKYEHTLGVRRKE